MTGATDQDLTPHPTGCMICLKNQVSKLIFVTIRAALTFRWWPFLNFEINFINKWFIAYLVFSLDSLPMKM